MKNLSYFDSLKLETMSDLVNLSTRTSSDFIIVLSENWAILRWKKFWPEKFLSLKTQKKICEVLRHYSLPTSDKQRLYKCFIWNFLPSIHPSYNFIKVLCPWRPMPHIHTNIVDLVETTSIKTRFHCHLVHCMTSQTFILRRGRDSVSAILITTIPSGHHRSSSSSTLSSFT